jgi:uncharacterized protein (TIGR03086 family)
MDPRAQQFLDHAAAFTPTVDAVTDWKASSPCAGWTAHDVLDHVIDTQRAFVELRDGELGERPTGEGADLWRAHLEQVRTLVADDAWVAGEYDSQFGRAKVGDTLVSFFGFDLVVHRWDLARSNDLDGAWTAEEADFVERSLDGLGDAIYTDGVCADAVEVPDGAPPQARLLGRMGRRP